MVFELPIWNFHQVLSKYHPTISGQQISSQGHLRSFNTFWIDHQKMANVCLPSGLKNFEIMNFDIFQLSWFQMIQIQI